MKLNFQAVLSGKKRSPISGITDMMAQSPESTNIKRIKKEYYE